MRGEVLCFLSVESCTSWNMFWERFYSQFPLNHGVSSAARTVRWFLLGEPPTWPMLVG
jgi:hypothetical protein